MNENKKHNRTRHLQCACVCPAETITVSDSSEIGTKLMCIGPAFIVIYNQLCIKDIAMHIVVLGIHIMFQ